jgi:hypothetical protein
LVSSDQFGHGNLVSVQGRDYIANPCPNQKETGDKLPFVPIAEVIERITGLDEERTGDFGSLGPNGEAIPARV